MRFRGVDPSASYDRTNEAAYRLRVEQAFLQVATGLELETVSDLVAALTTGTTPGYATLSTDANATITRGSSITLRRHTGTLTADRTLTLDTTGAVAGDLIRVTRTGSGAFNLVFASKNLATNTWADAIYDGSAWFLAGYGSL